MEPVTARAEPLPPWPIPFRYGIGCFLVLALLEAALAFAAGLFPGIGERGIVLVTFLARTSDGVLLMVFLRGRGLGGHALGLHPGTWTRGVRHAVYWGAACGAAACAIYLPPLVARCSAGDCPALPFPMAPFPAFMALLYGPLVEELVFRGWLYGALRNRCPALAAVPLNALLFAALHGFHTASFVPALAGGVLFCMSYERSRSIVTPILLHVSGNTALLVCESLAR